MNNEDIKEPTSASKNGGTGEPTLVDTSVESTVPDGRQRETLKAVEPNVQPINPPKTTELKPQELPKVSNDVSTDVNGQSNEEKWKDALDKFEEEYNRDEEERKKPKFWERDEVYKKLLRQWKTAFRDFSE